MLCQHCQQNSATTHVKRSVNGKTTELHLCSDCASTLGVGIFSNGGIDVGNLFGGLFADPHVHISKEQNRCAVCGKSLRDIVQSGLVGCPDCYTTFYERLLPSIQRIHGKTSHVGKVAADGSRKHHHEQELDRLRAELNEAVAAQEYERCAQLRDRIKELEASEDE